MNWYGMLIYFNKESWRFLKVFMQTVMTPVITVMLYLVVFASVLSEHVEIYPGVPYTAFLLPGLIMMSILQNAFANTSSSLFQSKQNGSVVFILLAPISSTEFYLAMVGASILRGFLVGFGVWLAGQWFVDLPLAQPAWVVVFALLGSLLLGSFGLIASVRADRWDHLSAFQNFIILPLSFLSGAFYSIQDLPGIWSTVSYFNPFFYLIDGFRHGFLGQSDISPWFSLGIIACFATMVSAYALWMLRSGYKLRT